jgi:hypothetical protein
MYTETLGIAGLTWQDKVRAVMIAKGQLVNVAMVNNLFRDYVGLISSGVPAPLFDGNALKVNTMLVKLKAISRQTAPMVFAFLSAVYSLSHSAKISMAIYDPVKYAADEKTRSELSPNALDLLKKGAGAYVKLLSKGMLVVALGAAAILAIKFLPSRK